MIYRDDLMGVINRLSLVVMADYKAVFQFIQENNMNLDSYVSCNPKFYGSGRLEFRNNQTRLIDLRRNYETAMGYVVKGFFINLAGYPKIDLPSTILWKAQERFDTKVDKPLKLR